MIIVSIILPGLVSNLIFKSYIDIFRNGKNPHYTEKYIALGRLSPAKAADALFALIRPEF
jgi:hypothetical protein